MIVIPNELTTSVDDKLKIPYNTDISAHHNVFYAEHRSEAMRTIINAMYDGHLSTMTINAFGNAIDKIEKMNPPWTHEERSKELEAELEKAKRTPRETGFR